MAAPGGSGFGSGGGGSSGPGWNPARAWPPAYKKMLEEKEKKLVKGEVHDPRVAAQKQAGEQWGAGLDEEIATRVQKKLMKSGAMGQALAQQLTWVRERTSALIWKTQAGELAGHPGAMKNDPMLRGFVSKEHNTRDRLRYEGVETELDAMYNGTATAEDVGIKARLMTIKHMMSPAEEIAGASSHAYVLNASIPRLNQPGAMAQLAEQQQNHRETLKWETARDMLRAGHHALVPKTFQDFLTAPPSATSAASSAPAPSYLSSAQAMANYQAAAAAGGAPVNTAGNSQTDEFRNTTLQNASASAPPAGGRPRALSNPRRV